MYAIFCLGKKHNNQNSSLPAIPEQNRKPHDTFITDLWESKRACTLRDFSTWGGISVSKRARCWSPGGGCLLRKLYTVACHSGGICTTIEPDHPATRSCRPSGRNFSTFRYHVWA